MQLIPFRPITRGRLKRSRVIFLLLTALALAFYGATVAHYAMPGISASWITWVTGLDVREAPVRPLLSTLGAWVASLPYGSLALRLNLLAVVAGALAIGWVYKIVWFLIFDMMREESAVTHASRNARFGGLVAASTMALSLPVWQAATSFRPEIFDVAMLMGIAYLLVMYAHSQNILWLLLFGVLYGMGIAESPLFLIAAPVMIAFALITEWKLEWCRITWLFVAAWLALGMLVLTHFWAAHSFLIQTGEEPSLAAILHCIVLVLRAQAQTLPQFLPKQFWVPVIMLGIGSAALTFFSAFRTLDNRRTWSLFFLNLVLTLFALLLLFNVSFSPWGVMAAKGVMPTLTYALTGIGIGLLTASWRALALMNDPVDADVEAVDNANELEPTSQSRVIMASRGTAILFVPLLLSAIVISGALNARFVLKDNAAFMDQVANGMLDTLNGRRWVVSNGLMDQHLLIGAYERKLVINLLCPYRSREPHYTAHILKAVQSDPSFSENTKLRAESLARDHFHLFIDDFFASDENIAAKAVCLGLPDIWYGTGLVPVPEHIFFSGAKTSDKLDGLALYTSHTNYWQSLKAFLRQPEGSPRQLAYRSRLALRRHLALVANNLGVVLEDAEQPEKAFKVYCQARAIYADNISALLNIFEMISRGYHPEMRNKIDKLLRHKVAQGSERYPLWALSRYYGYVRNYELFINMGWQWALSSTPSSILAGLRSTYALQQDEDQRAALSAMMGALYEMRGDYKESAVEFRKTLKRDPKNVYAISGLTRLALQQSVVEEARSILEAGEAAGASKRLLRQDWAALYLVAGDLPRARVLLQELGEESDASPMALALLAMVMIEQKDFGAVETKVLPRLAKGKSAEGQNAYFVQVVQGRLWQNKGLSGYKNARICFQRAALIRPDVQAVFDVLLMLDVVMDDQKAAEARALTILRQRADHPYANFIMGSIRLEQAQYGDAESYLRRSAMHADATLAAMNNYAQVLCRLRRLDEALKIARQAVERFATRYEGWSTLAMVLAERGSLDEAMQAMQKARSFEVEDKRLYLLDALIATKRGDVAAAEKALGMVREEGKLSMVDRSDIKLRMAEIARLRQN